MTTLVLADLTPSNATKVKIRWSCDGNTITCSRGHLSASVEAPWRGRYTDARMWNSLVRQALTVAESRLVIREFRERV